MRGLGFAPLLPFVDHGARGTAECLAGLLRPGKANESAFTEALGIPEAFVALLRAGATFINGRLVERHEDQQVAETPGDPQA